jgi:hypothetical protein
LRERASGAAVAVFFCNRRDARVRVQPAMQFQPASDAFMSFYFRFKVILLPFPYLKGKRA